MRCPETTKQRTPTYHDQLPIIVTLHGSTCQLFLCNISTALGFRTESTIGDQVFPVIEIMYRFPLCITCAILAVHMSMTTCLQAKFTIHFCGIGRCSCTPIKTWWTPWRYSCLHSRGRELRLGQASTVGSLERPG
jgi:hypothetical protein